MAANVNPGGATQRGRLPPREWPLAPHSDRAVSEARGLRPPHATWHVPRGLSLPGGRRARCALPAESSKTLSLRLRLVPLPTIGTPTSHWKKRANACAGNSGTGPPCDSLARARDDGDDGPARERRGRRLRNSQRAADGGIRGGAPGAVQDASRAIAPRQLHRLRAGPRRPHARRADQTPAATPRIGEWPRLRCRRGATANAG
jgi:hypothetical protein